VAADALGIVVHDLLPVFVPVVRLVGALSNTDLAVDAPVLVAFDLKFVVVFVDRLKQHCGHLSRDVGWLLWVTNPP
jgi:hypothetical protein